MIRNRLLRFFGVLEKLVDVQLGLLMGNYGRGLYLQANVGIFRNFSIFRLRKCHFYNKKNKQQNIFIIKLFN